MQETPEYLADKADVAKLNFRRSDKIGDLLQQLHAALQEESLEENHDKVRMMTGWMKTALTLWAVPADSIGRHMVKELFDGRELDPAMNLLLELMDNVPSAEENRVISNFEDTVYRGLYEELVETKDKYDIKLKELQCNKEFQKQLAAFDALFPFVKFQNEKGILRRTLVPERNLRSDWTFLWSDERNRMQIVLDAFCHRFHLYGFEKGQPLLLKPSVNPTPHGLMIFIPAYWSFDPRRDLNWKAIIKLLKARGIRRQGAKMSESRLQRIQRITLAYRAELECQALGYTGRKRWEHIRTKLGLSAYLDIRTIREMVSDGRDLVCGNQKPQKKSKK